jgi:hypothetical protein
MLAGGSPLALEECGACSHRLAAGRRGDGYRWSVRHRRAGSVASDPNYHIVKLIDVPQTLAASENPRLMRLVFSWSWMAIGLVLSKGTRRLA